VELHDRNYAVDDYEVMQVERNLNALSDEHKATGKHTHKQSYHSPDRNNCPNFPEEILLVTNCLSRFSYWLKSAQTSDTQYEYISNKEQVGCTMHIAKVSQSDIPNHTYSRTFRRPPQNSLTFLAFQKFQKSGNSAHTDHFSCTFHNWFERQHYNTIAWIPPMT